MPFDITFTAKESVANGRRLMRADDGSTYWEPVDAPAFANPALTGAVTEYLETKPVKPVRKPRKKNGT